MLPELLAASLNQFHATGEAWQQYLSLLKRERDVDALACLSFTNPEIAIRLGVSLNTFKTHMHNVLGKFKVSNRNKLRQKLADWDFSAWAHWM